MMTELLVTLSEVPQIYYQKYTITKLMNNNILAIAFLIAGTLLTTTAVITMVPAAYAEDDHDNDNGDGNKLKAEDESAGAISDCDDNDVEEAGFDCISIALADLEIED
jgi:hypothetical protein